MIEIRRGILFQIKWKFDRWELKSSSHLGFYWWVNCLIVALVVYYIFRNLNFHLYLSLINKLNWIVFIECFIEFAAFMVLHPFHSIPVSHTDFPHCLGSALLAPDLEPPSFSGLGRAKLILALNSILITFWFAWWNLIEMYEMDGRQGIDWIISEECYPFAGYGNYGDLLGMSASPIANICSAVIFSSALSCLYASLWCRFDGKQSAQRVINGEY